MKPVSGRDTWPSPLHGTEVHLDLMLGRSLAPPETCSRERGFGLLESDDCHRTANPASDKNDRGGHDQTRGDF